MHAQQQELSWQNSSQCAAPPSFSADSPPLRQPKRKGGERRVLDLLVVCIIEHLIIIYM